MRANSGLRHRGCSLVRRRLRGRPVESSRTSVMRGSLSAAAKLNQTSVRFRKNRWRVLSRDGPESPPAGMRGETLPSRQVDCLLQTCACGQRRVICHSALLSEREAPLGLLGLFSKLHLHLTQGAFQNILDLLGMLCGVDVIVPIGQVRDQAQSSKCFRDALLHQVLKASLIGGSLCLRCWL